MTAQEIKDFCKLNAWSYADLAQRLGLASSSVKNALSTGNISGSMAKGVELLIEIQSLKEQLAEFERFKDMLKGFVKSS